MPMKFKTTRKYELYCKEDTYYSSNIYRSEVRENINTIDKIYCDIYDPYFITINTFKVNGKQLNFHDLSEILKTVFKKMDNFYHKKNNIELFRFVFKGGGISSQNHYHIICYLPKFLNFINSFSEFLLQEFKNKNFNQSNLNNYFHYRKINRDSSSNVLNYIGRKEDLLTFYDKFDLYLSSTDFTDIAKATVKNLHSISLQRYYDKAIIKGNYYDRFFVPLAIADHSNSLPLIDVREIFNEEFQDKLYNYHKDNLIFLLPAEVGVGKTTAINSIDTSKMSGKTLIVFPTHDIKSQVTIGVELPKIPAEIEKDINYCYEKNKNPYKYLDKDKLEIFKQWRIKEKYILSNNKVIRTTHQKYLAMQPKLRNSFDNVIFDECFLNSYIKIDTISGGDFKKIKFILPILKDLPLNEVIDITNLKGTMNLSIIKSHFNFSYIRKLIDAKYLIMREDELLFVHNNSNCFDNHKKIIVLSATASKIAYKYIFKSKLKIVEIPKPKLKAKIYQDLSVAYTKSQINDLKSKIKKKYDKIKDYLIRRAFEVISYKGSNSVLHFFNSFGTNKLKGKNILVAGTPNPNMDIFKLTCAAIGFDHSKIIGYSNDYADYTVNNKKIRYHKISDDMDIQNFFFDIISAEIIQAVGRTRPYEEESIVVILSRMPHPDSDVYVSFENLKPTLNKFLKSLSIKMENL